MQLPSKIFLATAVAGLGLGAWVSGTSVRLHPIWTLALPLGVVSLGMFFLTYFLQGPAARYDEDQSRKFTSTQPNPGGEPAPNREQTEQARRGDGLTTGHVH